MQNANSYDHTGKLVLIQEPGPLLLQSFAIEVLFILLGFTTVHTKTFLFGVGG